MKAVYYALLFASALIFSSQFLITRAYQRRNGTGFISSVKLSLGAYFTIAVFFLIKGSITYGKFNLGFSTFTFGMTLLIALVSLSCVFMGIKVLAVGDMSIYSVFMMLGSLVLPTFVGLVFYKESFGLIKGIAILLMFAAIIFSISASGKKVFNIKALICYIGIFLMNGMIGVLFTVHQNHPELTALAVRNNNGSFSVNNDAFMTWYGLSTVILSSIVYLVIITVKAFENKKHKSKTDINSGDAEIENKSQNCYQSDSECNVCGKQNALSIIRQIAIFIVLPVLYGLCNGLGDYFIAIATQPGALGSSVTFPIINGGTILFSSLFGLIFYKEKFRLATYIALALVMASTVLFMFA